MLIEVGKCMVDINEIVAVEPHRFFDNRCQGYNEGAKITMKNGVAIIEEGQSLSQVKKVLVKAIRTASGTVSDE